MLGMRDTRIKERSPNPQPLERERPEFLWLRQPGPPNPPQGVAPDHFFSIRFQALHAFLLYSRSPLRFRLDIWKRLYLDGRLPQHIKIVYLAQDILQFLEIFAPCLMQAWQEILYRVPQALYPDAQLMKAGLGAVAQRLAMQITRFLPTFQGEVGEHRAIDWKASRTGGQLCRPGPPLLAIE